MSELVLCVLEQGRVGRVVGLDDLPLRIGHGPDADLALPGTGPAKVLGILSRSSQGRLELETDGASRPLVLSPGSHFPLGGCVLAVVAAPRAPTPRTPAPADPAQAARIDPTLPLAELIGRLWSAEDEEKRLEVLLRGLVDVFGAAWGAFVVPGPDGELRTACSAGTRPAGAGDRVSRTVLAELVASGRPVFAADVPSSPALARASSIAPQVASVIAARLGSPERPEGTVYLESPVARRTFTPDEQRLLERLAALAADQLARAQNQRELAESCERLGELHRLEMEREHDYRNLVGSSPRMREVGRQIGQASGTDVTVLVLGETGTGKELVAKAIHAGSNRRQGPFVAVNCAALAKGVAESELFGHVRGAFTGAVSNRRGRFEMANGGTLFLDEVGDLEPALQSKLLRILQERTYQRVGESLDRRLDVRLVAATNLDLSTLVREGKFREDLYYRLSVFTLPLPPLRERGHDVVELAERFRAELCRRHGRAHSGFDEEALDVLARHSWPGNVRELRNVVEQAVVRAEGDRIRARDFVLSSLAATVARSPASRGATPTEGDPTDLRPYEEARTEWEREFLRRALAAAQGNVQATAEALGIGRTTLYRRLWAHGLVGAGRKDPGE